MNEKGIATLLREYHPGSVAHVSLYGVIPGIAYYVYGVKHTTNYVIVSALHDHLMHETYIFPADESGLVINWGELDGSLKGTTSHQKALEGAGYKLIASSPVQA